MKKIIYLMAVMLLLSVFPAGANAENWYFKPAKDHARPATEPEYAELLNQYHGIWIGPAGQKTVYLTFDNGYEQGYTARILDELKKEHVPAAFFITGHYIKDKPELVKRMVDEGHIVGNHSWGHPDLTKISDEKYKQELKKLDDAYQRLTGEPKMTYLRPPRGIFSKRALELGDEMGYTSVFWSFAYKDWIVDEQMGARAAYKSIMNRVHPGAILLLHTVSKDNADVLPQVIDDLRAKGYTFGSLDELMAERTLPAPFR